MSPTLTLIDIRTDAVIDVDIKEDGGKVCSTSILQYYMKTDLGTYVYALLIIGQLVNDYFPKQNRVVLQ